MLSRRSDRPQEFLEIKHDDKFYTRLLSKESSAANPSFRVYYGGAAGAVPFMWESRPGTPKYSAASAALPPLTPPPSYQYSKNKNRTAKKSSLINTILPLLALRKTHAHPPPPSPSSVSLSSSSTSSSSSSYSPTGSSGSHRRIRFSSSRSSFSSLGEDDALDGRSRAPTLCGAIRW